MIYLYAIAPIAWLLMSIGLMVLSILYYAGGQSADAAVVAVFMLFARQEAAASEAKYKEKMKALMEEES